MQFLVSQLFLSGAVWKTYSRTHTHPHPQPRDTSRRSWEHQYLPGPGGWAGGSWASPHLPDQQGCSRGIRQQERPGSRPRLPLDCCSKKLNSFCFCRVVHGAAKSDSRSQEPTSPIQGAFQVLPASLPIPSLPPSISDGLLPGCSCHGHHLLAPGSGSAESPANRWLGPGPGRWSDAHWRQKL